MMLGRGGALLTLPLMLVSVSAASTSGGSEAGTSCGDIKKMYKGQGCCKQPDKVSAYQVVPMPKEYHLAGDTTAYPNVCKDKRPYDGSAPGDGYFNNVNCTLENGVLNALEQSGTDVTVGYKGEIDTTGRAPITDPYWKAALCPVNVHWHLGTEHRSAGQYDETGSGPPDHRRLAAGAKVRKGMQCKMYDATKTMYTTEYDWQHCVGMKVGETYEVHWPHSKAGACGTPNQYQTPFYDGVFCIDGIVTLTPLTTFSTVGVQAQIFTIVNDDKYYYPDLIKGMIVDGAYGQDIVKYTGSTTGTTRSNEICSKYTPITWQVDRKCHLISASAFDKMCADMKAIKDDMSGDLYAHGAREVVPSKYAADNHQRL